MNGMQNMNGMQKLPLLPMAIVALVAQFVVAGCSSGSGGGSVFGSIFSDGSIESALDLFGSDDGFETVDEGDSTSTIDIDDGDEIQKIATINNPEPASLALFGGGLAVAAATRRRRKRRQLQA